LLQLSSRGATGRETGRTIERAGVLAALLTALLLFSSGCVSAPPQARWAAGGYEPITLDGKNIGIHATRAARDSMACFLTVHTSPAETNSGVVLSELSW